jgi:hypothetical protein
VLTIRIQTQPAEHRKDAGKVSINSYVLLICIYIFLIFLSQPSFAMQLQDAINTQSEWKYIIAYCNNDICICFNRSNWSKQSCENGQGTF